MSQLFAASLVGLGAGSMYALSALGVVAVYRGSGVINFASGAMGMVGTFVFWILADQCNWPVLPALLIGVATSGALGVTTHFLIMRPLRDSSNLVKLVATLGLLIALQSGMDLIYSSNTLIAQPFLPHGETTMFGATVGSDRLWLFGFAVVLTIGATLIYSRTRFGLATTAIAENPGVTASMGWSPDTLAAVNWAVGGCLAGFAGICLAPIVGVSVSTALLLLLPSLAAAVAGGMRSFAITAIAAMAIGILQSVLPRYVSTPGVPDAIPFVAIVAVLILRGRTLPSRDVVREVFPRVSSGRIPWVLATVCTLGLTFVLAGRLSYVWVGAITTSLAVSLVLLSLVVVTGYAGQLSLAQYAIAVVSGGLVSAHLSVIGLSFPFAALCGIAAAVPVGLLLGLPAVRTRGPALAIVTLGFSVVVIDVVFGNTWLAGGYDGLTLRDPTIFGIDLNPTVYPDRYAIMSLVCVVACCLMVANLRRGRAGRRMLAVRSNERAATAVGVSVRGTKLAAFAIAAAIAAVAGVLLTFAQPVAIFASYSPFDSIEAVSYAVVGGLGFVTGALSGSVLAPGGVGSQALSLFGSQYGGWLDFAGGLLTILTVVLYSNGVAAFNVDRAQRVRKLIKAKLRYGSRSSKRPLEAPQGLEVRRGEQSTLPRQSHTLEARCVSVRFGGLLAVDQASFRATSAEILAVIGANGAGKTTVIDAITGFVRLADGEILLDGKDVSHMEPTKRARLGISRSFQSLELFEDLTVRENLLAGCDDVSWKYWFTDLFWPGRAKLPASCLEILHDLDLVDDLDKLPSELSFGKRRLVAIARALARDPSVILLDEPAAGLDISERQELAQTIRHLAKRSHTAVIVVEHDLDLIRAIADQVVVMEFGRCIAIGKPDEVLVDPSVIASYVGSTASRIGA
jgi:ABC-type branched-subunit amino acid transport system ATPase component/branched-subunit amino acid ABC-type transport system permease component